MRSTFKFLGFRNSQFLSLTEASSSFGHLQPRSSSTSIAAAFAANCDAAAADSLLEQNGLPLDRKLVAGTLKSLYANPEAASKFFNWISSKDSQRLSSKDYNLMLRILGSHGLTSEFWNLASVMKEKGYEVSGRVKSESGGSDTDSIRSLLKSGERSSDKVSMVIRSRVWGEDLEEEIRGMGLELSADYLKNVIENLATEPTKALMFFRWTEEMVKHESSTYNAVARVLIREDCIARFWKILNEMNTNAHRIELQTYIKAENHFLRKKQHKEAVEITTRAIADEITLPHCTFTHLLKKISSAKDLDVELFTRVVNLMAENQIPLTNSMVSSVVKSLASVDRMSEGIKIIKIMKEGGLVIDGNLEREIARYLTKHHGAETVREVIESWKAIIEAHCEAGRLREARESFRALVGGMEGERRRDAFHCLMEAYCGKSGRKGYELVKEEVEVKPWRRSYAVLIEKLVKEGAYLEAVEVAGMMRRNGYQPSIRRLMEYLKTKGTVDDAAALMEALAAPPKIGEQIFRELFEGGRYEEGRMFFRKCGAPLRSNPAVLSMLAESMNS